MGLMVGDYLDVTLAERHEKQDTFATSLTACEVRGKFPMRELPCICMLHAGLEARLSPVEIRFAQANRMAPRLHDMMMNIYLT